MATAKRNSAAVGLLLALLPGVAGAEFVISEVEAVIENTNLRVSARVEINLSEQAELAVDNGVPLVILTEFELQEGGAIWDKALLQRRVRRQLRYHSLADRYVVEDLESGDIDLYDSVDAALGSMGVLRERAFVLPSGVNLADPEYTLAVRSRLDINRLPTALRPLAFFSPSWRLSSDWTTWQVTTR